MPDQEVLTLMSIGVSILPYQGLGEASDIPRHRVSLRRCRGENPCRPRSMVVGEGEIGRQANEVSAVRGADARSVRPPSYLQSERGRPPRHRLPITFVRDFGVRFFCALSLSRFVSSFPSVAAGRGTQYHQSRRAHWSVLSRAATRFGATSERYATKCLISPPLQALSPRVRRRAITRRDDYARYTPITRSRSEESRRSPSAIARRSDPNSQQFADGTARMPATVACFPSAGS